MSATTAREERPGRRRMEPAPRDPAGGGDVRARRRHVADERVDLGRRHRPRHDRVSGVQAAIALEALVSAAFILISSKVGDLIGRKLAYVLGLLGYAIGALAMVLAQRPASRSSSSGRSSAASAPRCCCRRCSRSSTATSRAPRRSGSTRWSAPRPRSRRPSARSSAASSPPTSRGASASSWSWSSSASCCPGIGMVRDVPYTGDRRVDYVGAVLSVVGMGGIVLGILVWQEGGEAVGRLHRRSALVSLGLLWWWLVRRKRAGKVTLLDPDLLRQRDLPAGHQRPDAPADLAGRR